MRKQLRIADCGSRIGGWSRGLWLIVATFVFWGSVALGGTISKETIKAFLEHVERSDAYPVEAKAFVARVWGEGQGGGDAESFIAESLAVLSERFRGGLDAYEDDDYAKAFEIMKGLSSDDDAYVSANASVFAIKALVEVDKLDEARELLESFLSDATAVDLYTSYAGETAYLRGYLALRDLQYDEAIRALREMLERYPEAGQRLRVSAQQILAELYRREPERIGDVADLMTYAGGRLGHQDTGQQVRDRQQRAIDLLEQLIEEAQKNEQSGGGGEGSSGSGGGKQSPSNPMQDSTLPGGGGAGVQLRSNRRARPGEDWGSMPPAEREKILQSLRDSFPSRYRQLVEQYYEELAKQP